MDHSEYRRQKNLINERYEKKQISKKARAVALSEIEAEYKNLSLEPETVFSFDDVYELNEKEFFVMKLVICFSEKDKKSMEHLFYKYFDYIKETTTADGVVYHTFYFAMRQSKYKKAVEESQENINLYSDLLTIPTFLFLMSLTPLYRMFGVKGVPALLDKFNLIPHGIFLFLNNGSAIYDVRPFINSSERNEIRPIYYPDVDLTLRSRWEANIARVLNYLGISWNYESEGFILDDPSLVEKYGYNTYNPDFFFDDKIIEVKGFWDSHSIKKVQLFKEQYKERPLFIIDHDVMHSIQERYSKLVPQWEILKKLDLYAEKIPVVGITIKDRAIHVKKLKKNDNIVLSRDANNAYDANAIKVFNEEGNQIGFVAKEWASIYSGKMDIGITCDAVIHSIDDKVIQIIVSRNNYNELALYEFLR